MAYNIKDVFYLSTEATIASGTANGGSAQLDLSAYIDPIARGRSKGTGLAIYKCHFAVTQSNSDPIDDAESGTFSYGLQAGLGIGDVATGGITTTSDAYKMTNALLVESGAFYGPKSMIANASTTVDMFPNTAVMPSKDVPYVIVRDNVCLTYNVKENMVNETILSVRLECAQVTLDQATLNQLLRTQTV
tara:strand:+ start:34 stop:603 length:570 start_codon:yes stop_codon:yes gene_type:complete